MRGRDVWGVDKAFPGTLHGRIGCINCHKGKNADNVAEAHKGLVKDPSAADGGVCGQCHAGITSTYKNAMHYRLTGIRDIVNTIIEPHKLQDTLLPAAFKLDCNNCHATCGSCHVAWPIVAKGGLLARHMFQKNPPMEKTCYACHGSRYAGEYMGLLGPYADVHYEKYQMVCTDCHKGDFLHNTRPADAKRFYAVRTPMCENCHPNAVPGKSNIPMHNAHKKNELACTVCHATEYFNCTNCHVSLDVKEPGKITVIFPAGPLETFKIGRNYDRSRYNPYAYDLVRHTPMLKNSLASFRYFQYVLTGKPGPEDLISNYNALPTWNSASVHTIRLRTPQNRTCNSCHGHKELFLTKSDLNPVEPTANLKIIVTSVPPPVGRR
ncbi:MAG: hypothetical protein M0Z58_00110 [Nitrospiraceae bacterium]|nr:hypothetical protein [Nitrospiraceae bacterium]